MDGTREGTDAIDATSPRRTAIGRLLAIAGVLAATGIGAGNAAAKPGNRRDRRRDRTRANAAVSPRQSLFTVRTVKQSHMLGINQTLSLTASCADDEEATGGGHHVETSTAGVFVHRSAPESSTPREWTATFINSGRQTPVITTYVVCMKSRAFED